MRLGPGQPPEPTDDEARLADLLDTCLRAEQGAPGSAAEVVRGAPDELRDELNQLLSVAQALAAAEWRSPSPEFRARARGRIEAQSTALSRAGSRVALRRAAPWLLRVAAGLAALALGGYGGVIASAASLPGEPLYAVKQADEFVTLSLTRDDLSRAVVLLQQASVRLDEATRLAGDGRVQAAVDVLGQYVATLERAAASLSKAQTVDTRTRSELEARLQQQLSQLESLARDAPPPLREPIQQARAATTQELTRTQGPSGVEPGTPTPSATVSASPAASPSGGAPSQPTGSPSVVSSPVSRP